MLLFTVQPALFLVSALCIAFLRIGDLGQAAREDRGVAALSGRASVVRGFVVLWEDRVLRTLTIAYLIIASIYLPTESIVLAAHFEALAEPASLGFVISMLAAGATIGAFGFGWLSARLSRPMILRVTLVGTAVSILPMALLPPVLPAKVTSTDASARVTVKVSWPSTSMSPATSTVTV